VEHRELPNFSVTRLNVLARRIAGWWVRISALISESHLEESESLAAPAPSAAALRMRRHRERRRRAMRCMTVELRETEISALIRKGLLNDDARNDLSSVKGAFYAFLDRTLNP
jgi:hypothetical protein